MLTPLLMWLAEGAIGPYVVERLIERPGQRDWAERLSAGTGLPRPLRRRLRAWLERETVGALFTEGRLDEAVDGLAAELELSRREAELLLDDLAGRFLQSLDPSLAVAVADYRRAGEHREIKAALDARKPPGPVEVWPVRVGRPPVRADAFVDRSGLVRAVPGPATLTLAGDGGTGKTQLAAQIWALSTAPGDPPDGARSRRVGPDLAVWVDATTRASIEAAFARAAERVGAAGTFLEWLADTDRSWLIVLDDVTDPADLTGLWPAGPSGSVLITTRRREPLWPNPIEVLVYTPDEAREYLTERLGRHPRPDVLAESGSLAADLGYLPLALAQATAVILADEITCADYRAMWREAGLDELLPADPFDGHPRSTAATWHLAVTAADALPPAGRARPMAAVAALLDPGGFPDSVLTGAPVAERLGVSPAQARRVLRNLHRLSVLTHDPADADRAVRMHALAQRATRDSYDDLAGARRVAADALLEIWPEIDTLTDIGAVLRANASVLSEAGLDGHPVLLRLASSFVEAGQTGRAIQVAELLYEDRRRILGPDHDETRWVRSLVAHWRGRAGDASGARSAFEELLAETERVLGPDAPETLALRGTLAHWQGETGDVVDAVRSLEKLAADTLRILGPGDSLLPAVQGRLAHWRGEAGDARGAVTALEDLLALWTGTLGPDDPHTLATRGNLAFWRGTAGDFAGAVSAFEELLAEETRVLGPDHPNTFTTRYNLAHWRRQAGLPVETTVLEELLADMLGVLDPDAGIVLSLRNLLAVRREEDGDDAGAVLALEELLRDVRRISGPDSPSTFAIRNNLAGRRLRAGDRPGAASAFAELLDAQTRVLGPDHPDTLITRHNLAGARGEAGDAGAAVKGFEETLFARTRVLGPDHPDVHATRANLDAWKERLPGLSSDAPETGTLTAPKDISE